MQLNPFYRSVFFKLFASVMLALILFTLAIILLTKVIQDSNNEMRSEILAGQVIEQINPFLHDLNEAPNRLQSRFMLAVVKKSFDIFDESLDAKMGLYDLKGHLLIQTEGSDLPKQLPPPPTWFQQTFPTLAGVAPNNSARALSPAGYTLFLEPRQSPKHNALTAMFNLFTGTLLLLFMMGITVWWIARSMTKRLNQMSKQMAQLGEGDFSVRVKVKGNDEISSLASGFNQSAEKIEKLINANNLLLAHASHEFRTPITRMRLQIEMMDMIAEQLPEQIKKMFDKRANAVTRDLTGLNDLIESILLVSRLDAGHALQEIETLDLHHLISQETQHYPQATLHGSPTLIQGQPKLLTHLVRNLLNNAMIHGLPPIDIYLYTTETSKQAIVIPPALLDKSSLQMSTLTDETIDPPFDSITNKNSENIENKKSDKSLPTRRRIPHLPTPKLGRKSQELKTTPEFAVMSVIDQGSGIPEEKREDIFSPFVRLQQEKKGSGLGLSLVAQIVEAHQGQIYTDIWQGHTRFLIILPIKAKKPAF